jgi:Tfp pilus assembly protein PilF
VPDGDDVARDLMRDMDNLVTASPPSHPQSASLVARVQHVAFAALLVALVLVVASPALAGEQRRRKPAPQPAVPLVVAAPTPAALAMLDAAIAEGRLDDARQMLAPMWASGVPEVALRNAELALAAGSLPEAAEGFSGLVDGPLAAAARQGLGITRLRQGRAAEAKAALEQAVAADQTLARAWNALGVLADKAKDWPAADTAYGKAIAAAPNDASLLANRGWSLLMRGHPVAAEQDLARALALAPGLQQARTNLALARALQGRYEDAFRLSDKKTLAGDLNTVGYAAMSRGDYAVAEAYFNRALSLNPQFDRVAWENLQYLAGLKSAAAQP